MKRIARLLFIIFAALLIGSELFLRFYFGFCDTVLVREDKYYEYIPVANQTRFRFRKHIRYNSMSMRSEEIDSTAVHIAGFGDSIINGGVLTDQDSLATTLLSDSLTRLTHHKVQFLNISAGSWGPDNCFAYLQQHGDFNARHIYLFVSSHDAYDNMNFEKVVGVNESFPDHQYRFALAELVNRYLLPRLGLKEEAATTTVNNLGINKKEENSLFNSGFQAFADYCQQKQLPLTLYLHAEQSEVIAGQYNEQGQEIIRFAESHHLPLIKDLDYGLQLSDFRDDIHLNDQGQRKMAMAVLRAGI